MTHSPDTVAIPAEAITQLAQGHIQGDVVVAVGVAIAPSVFLSAAPGCRLVIAPGVCLGSDVILHVHGGDLVVELGVNLGSGVLVVGRGAIGQHTCVGANSTLINPDLGPSQVVAPGSLVGAPNQPEGASATHPRLVAQFPGASTAAPLPDPWAGSTDSSSHPAPSQQNGTDGTIDPEPRSGNVRNGTPPKTTQVYGKAQVNRMLASLFPQRQSLNGSGPNSSDQNTSP